MKEKGKITIYIQSQNADSGPPLSTILGNFGINTLKFCKDFNEYTKELPSYFLLKVFITVFEDRSFSFLVFLPSTGFILSLLKFKQKYYIHGVEYEHECISLESVVRLSLFKFPGKSLEESVPIILGSMRSSNINIEV